ncbi:cysteine desulfurase family protein, partial [Leucobacter sp. M11]|uniref:cysteine desulfurase family protein n=1 Tax=Leucobacter sp. M11 TaxID=2993565 RepID=UPI002D7E968E
VVFTAGGTEAANLAIRGLALANPRGRHLVTVPTEHPAVLETIAALGRLHGFEITVLPVSDTGLVDPAAVADALRPDSTLVSVALGNNEIGTVQPVAEIAAAARAVGALSHSDAVQALGQVPVDFAALGVDALTCSAHKLSGPKGVGAALIRRQLPREPLIYGGGQERGSRSGTENVAGIVGFAAAVGRVLPERAAQREALRASRDRLIARVAEAWPDARLTGDPEQRLPGHVSWVFPGVSGESILVALDAAGISASSGSACAAGHDEPSPALLALGIEPSLAQTALRLTFHEPLDADTEDRVLATLLGELRR